MDGPRVVKHLVTTDDLLDQIVSNLDLDLVEHGPTMPTIPPRSSGTGPLRCPKC
ncbi:MAG: hypothetical protein QOJ56_5115 [Mycobacterium sp.]|nr:hypothetical protein [Mycobacterium sp.]